MITKIRIKNFRQIEDETIDLGQVTVLVGPNNGGKTTFLQALSLFGLAIEVWYEKRIDKKTKASKKTGVAIGIDRVLNMPIAEFRELWRNLVLRQYDKEIKKQNSIKIEIYAEGVIDNTTWQTGFEFEYARDNLIYIRLIDGHDFSEKLINEKIGYLPPVSGLGSEEHKLELGSIHTKIGNGQTADVLRNICYYLYDNNKDAWKGFTDDIKKLFAVELNAPSYNQRTGLLKMTYKEDEKKDMSLSSLGSGIKQVILLFAYLNAFKNTIILLDEPDAHLEIIRQSKVYDKISDLVKRNNGQLIIASHSESVLNSASRKDQVISSVFGKFELVNNDKYVRAALKNYGYEEYLVAKQKKRIFYFEGETDLEFIKAFCTQLGKSDLLEILEQTYCRTVGNDIIYTRNHFDALKKFIPDLKAYALFDNLDKEIQNTQEGLILKKWSRNEIENYIPLPDTLNRYADKTMETIWVKEFKDHVKNNIPPIAYEDKEHQFWKTTKISDDFLTPVFEQYFEKNKFPKSTMNKSKFYQLVDYVDIDLLDKELLDTIDEVCEHLI